MTALLDDRPGDRKDRTRIILQDLLVGVQALGHPGAGVKEAAGLAKWCKSYLRRKPADFFEPVHCGGKEGCGLLIAEKFEIARRRHAKSRPRTKARRFRRLSFAGQ